jgi:thiamine-monophosphate kinase
MTGEFDLIDRVLRPRAGTHPQVLHGIGDDCALVTVPEGQALAITTDTMVEAIHFPALTTAADLGWKALACSLSDLAAAGAEPAWATLSLVLPHGDEDWLRGFSAGFAELAERHGVALIGGDIVRGPAIMVTVQAAGHVAAGEFLGRGGAKAGDGIYVSGWPGEAAAALARLDEDVDPELRTRLDRPEPRVELGRFLRGRASACIDVSDGLAADLGHILNASDVGARIEETTLPVSPRLRALGTPASARRWILRGGDDYELCFTVPYAGEDEMMTLRPECPPLTRIGVIETEPGLRIVDAHGTTHTEDHPGHDHFRSTNVDPEA